MYLRIYAYYYIMILVENNDARDFREMLPDETIEAS